MQVNKNVIVGYKKYKNTCEVVFKRLTHTRYES